MLFSLLLFYLSSVLMIGITVQVVGKSVVKYQKAKGDSYVNYGAEEIYLNEKVSVWGSAGLS